MPHFCARLPPELHIAIVERVRAGESRKVVADELEVWGSVEKWTAHLPRGRRGDLVRASIVRRVEAGEDVRTIASLENCTISFVTYILRAWAGELDALARLSELKAPRRQEAKPDRRLKLTDVQVRGLRELAAGGVSDTELETTFGLSNSYVCDLRTGRSRPNAGGPFTRR